MKQQENGIIVSISCNPYTNIKEFQKHNSEYIFQELKREIADSIRTYHKYGLKFCQHIQLTIDIFPRANELNQLDIFQSKREV